MSTSQNTPKDDKPVGPVVDLFLQNGFAPSFPEPGIDTWTRTIAGTDEFVSIMYDREEPVGTDLDEARYLIGRYSHRHDGWVEVGQHFSPKQAMDIAAQLDALPALVTDEQCDYPSASDLSLAFPNP
ncbi:hypothetical protein [Thalassospira sp. CH_XMU1420-2]|uniref:hypothetical protein n=1 Tax=Thalassospira sp. CH_XMU1420-2 TaxID=3107769 RepID=UPI00300A7CAB|tara:strand:+ start:2548 stop:2928 length:381 start_codon:yes stop_codon:yes gene_type:complete